MGRFIIKHIDNRKPQVRNSQSTIKASVNTNNVSEKKEVTEEVKNNTVIDKPKNDVVENKIETNKEVMTTNEKITMAQNVLGVDSARVKRVKRDKGLIERTESSKTILTEDNKELLND